MAHHHHGWPGAPLSPADAAAWLAVWLRDQQERRRARIHPLLAGPGARPMRLAQYLRTGRGLFKTRVRGRGVRDAHGELRTDAAAMDALLWADRGPLWCSAPAQPATGDPLLASYFRHRGAAWPPVPAPSLDRLRGLILAQRDSAPGVDDEPYEVYHHGVDFVALLLAQGHFAADRTDAALTQVLGVAEDLLVWIPKLPGAERAKDWRPHPAPHLLSPPLRSNDRRAGGAHGGGTVRTGANGPTRRRLRQ